MNIRQIINRWLRETHPPMQDTRGEGSGSVHSDRRELLALEQRLTELERKWNEQPRPGSPPPEPPIVIQQLTVDKLMVEKLQYELNFGALGIKELTGTLNIGTNYGAGPSNWKPAVHDAPVSGPDTAPGTKTASGPKAAPGPDTAPPWANKCPDTGAQDSAVPKGPKCVIKSKDQINSAPRSL